MESDSKKNLGKLALCLFAVKVLVQPMCLAFSKWAFYCLKPFRRFQAAEAWQFFTLSGACSSRVCVVE